MRLALYSGTEFGLARSAFSLCCLLFYLYRSEVLYLGMVHWEGWRVCHWSLGTASSSHWHILALVAWLGWLTWAFLEGERRLGQLNPVWSNGHEHRDTCAFHWVTGAHCLGMVLIATLESRTRLGPASPAFLPEMASLGCHSGQVKVRLPIRIRPRGISGGWVAGVVGAPPPPPPLCTPPATFPRVIYRILHTTP